MPIHHETFLNDEHKPPMSPRDKSTFTLVRQGSADRQKKQPIFLKRVVSLDSINKSLKRTFAPSRQSDRKLLVENVVKCVRDINFGTAVEAHSSKGCYLAGSADKQGHNVSIQLFKFGQPAEKANFSTYSEGVLTACRFDPHGIHIGGADSRGDIHLWKFDNEPAENAFMSFRQCHTGPINDFLFVDSSTVVATAGISPQKQNVSLWDALMPAEKSRVMSFKIGDEGIGSLAHSPRHNVLIAGGKKGCLYVLDIRQGKLLNTIECHNDSVKCLAIKSYTDKLVSGSSRGEIKVFRFYSDVGS